MAHATRRTLACMGRVREPERNMPIESYQPFLTATTSTTTRDEMVKHLPPAIKQLLTLRNPGAFASPSVQALNSVLHATRSEAKKYGAENGWLVLSVRIVLTTAKYAVTKLSAFFCCRLALF